jgi:excisionase family DNA binding protein
VTDVSAIPHGKREKLPETLLVFTPEEALEVLRVGRATLYRRVREGQWPHRKMEGGVGVRFTVADLEEILSASYRPAVKP